MDVKTFAGVQVKDAAKGEVELVFARFDEIDKDGDVTLKNAFTDRAPVRISAYQHKSWEGALPVGRGEIRVGAKEAVMAGRFFMNTTAGRDTFEVVKQMGDLQEWSYGYDTKKSHRGEFEGKQVRFLEQQDVHEVSPVLIGAGSTRTLALKAGQRFSDEADTVLAAVTGLVDRAADVMAKRGEKGKALGDQSSALLADIHAQLKRLDHLLAQPSSEVEREYVRFLSLTSAVH